MDLAAFKLRSLAPASYIDQIEEAEPGWTEQQLTTTEALICARLRKRYAVPFALPQPEAFLSWLTALVTLRCYLKRGVDATDEQFARIDRDAADAVAEIKEAADSREGLFDLPLREDTSATGISKGAPLGYSEASPYTWRDRQIDDMITNGE